MRKVLQKHLLTCIVLMLMLSLPMLSFGKETAQSWELVNPQGIVKVEPMKVNPHPATLEGKTVVLRWNGKHNGDNVLNRVAEMLNEQVKGVKIIKLWEKYPGYGDGEQQPGKEQGHREESRFVQARPGHCFTDRLRVLYLMAGS